MEDITQLLSDVLEDLVEAELKQFTRQLWIGVKPGVEPIPRGKLENKDRQDVVDSMVQQYSEDAGTITVQTLRKIKQNERAKRLESNLLKVQSQGQENKQNSEEPQPIPQIISQPIQQIISQPINNAGSEDLQPIQADWQRPRQIIPCSQETKNTLLKAHGDDIYTPRSGTQRKGLALLITNIQFANTQHNRDGADRDEENAEWLLRSLGFAVMKYRNLSGKDIRRAVENFSKRREHEDADSTFIVIMSHGTRIDNKDAIVGVSDDVYFIEETFAHLNSVNCPALIDKPKVILIQACRGGQSSGVLAQDSVFASDSWVHMEKDFVCFMSTMPNTFAYRNPIEGSFFISYIVDVFCSSAHRDDIMELFRKVTLRMEKDQRFKGQAKLLPCIERTSISKRFYLFPGL
nr:Caspy2 [Danio rerio]